MEKETISPHNLTLIHSQFVRLDIYMYTCIIHIQMPYNDLILLIIASIYFPVQFTGKNFLVSL